jgi:hypothetical protein
LKAVAWRSATASWSSDILVLSMGRTSHARIAPKNAHPVPTGFCGQDKFSGALAIAA